MSTRVFFRTPALGALAMVAWLTATAAVSAGTRGGPVPIGIAALAHTAESGDEGTAKDLGLNFLHEKVSWDEPTPGDYRWNEFGVDDPFAKRLKAIKEAHYTIALTLNVVDDDKKKLPRYLADRPFNDPALLNRWRAFLEGFLDRYGAHIDFINVGYQVNKYFSKNSGQWKGFVAFVAAGHTVVRKKAAKVSVGVVLNDDDDPALYWRDVAPACTHFAMAYTAPASIIVTDPAANALNPNHGKFFGRTLEGALKMAGRRPILLLDVAFPTHASVDSSPALQSRFVMALFAWLRRAEARVGGLSYTGDKDWPYETTRDTLRNMLGEQILEYRGVIRYLTSCGLRYEDGRKKPAYEAFKQSLQAYRKRR